MDIQQVNITSAGELSIWDFSGYEPYYMLYDHFMGDPNCIHIVLFSLEEPQSAQLSQVTFWLNFIKARIPPYEPIGELHFMICRNGWHAKLFWKNMKFIYSGTPL